MQVIVEYKIFARGKTKVDTFNDLTQDPKDGVGLKPVPRDWSQG